MTSTRRFQSHKRSCIPNHTNIRKIDQRRDYIPYYTVILGMPLLIMYLNKGTTHSEKSQVKRPCMVRHNFRSHTLPTVIIQPKARSQHIPAHHRIMLPCSYNMKSPPKVQCTQCGLRSTQVALSARPKRTNPCCPSVWLQRCPKNHSHHSLMLLQQKHIY